MAILDLINSSTVGSSLAFSLFSKLRLEGDILRQPIYALYISEPLDIGAMNEHTIPDEIEFALVDLQVTTYCRLEIIPTYRELLGRLKKYARPFGKYLK